MLFVESKTSLQPVDGPTRVHLLDNLEAKGFSPLIRRMRLDCFQQALMNHDGDLVMSNLDIMENEVADWCEQEGKTQYIRGELFCFDDYVLYLLFVNGALETIGARAGIVYSDRTVEPLRKLESFCREVRDALKAARLKASRGDKASVMDFTEWRLDEPAVPESFKRFENKRALGFLNTEERKNGFADRARAATLMEDVNVRMALRRLREAHKEGHLAELSATGQSEAQLGSMLIRMAEAGLVQRHVVVSCSKTSMPLFRLPSPEALSAITRSGMTCSQCNQAISDEKLEEVVVPTDAAVELLEEGAWLSSYMRTVLSGAGLPENQIAVGPSPGEGEARMMANICGQPFMFVLFDGEVSLARANSALSAAREFEASHLVLMSTARIQDDARKLLHETEIMHGGSGKMQVLLLEGVAAPLNGLHAAVDKVVQRWLARELKDLDPTLGFSAGVMVGARFRLMVVKEEALADDAAAAAKEA